MDTPITSLTPENTMDLNTPFEHIALAFSGGGFRAAAFSLGVLSYLEQLRFFDHTQDKQTSLLSKVRYISSASGGTISNALYALYNVEGRSFRDYYIDMLGFMHEDDLLTEALEILNDENAWTSRKDKHRNTINAFAMAYDKWLFKGKTGADIAWKGTASASHLEEVCFNSTEFVHGLPFRQQIKLQGIPGVKDPYFHYGNHLMNLGLQVTGEIRLSDMLAASSCFPAGFEPIVFPDDFTYAAGNGNEKALNETMLTDPLFIAPQTGSSGEKAFLAKKRFGLMDGGITDNQGLESLMLADIRRIEGDDCPFKRFDFILVNDVGSQYMDPYEVPVRKDPPFWGSLTITALGWILGILGTLFLLLGFIAFEKHIFMLGVFSDILFTLTLLGLVIGMGIGRMLHGFFSGTTRDPALKPSPGEVTGSATALKLGKNFSSLILKNLLHYLRHTASSFLLQMVKARISSVLILTNDVFLKRIRQIIYEQFYQSSRWNYRRKGNHIYDLSMSNSISRQSGKYPDLEPTPIIQKIAETAYEMSTTLWFDRQKSEKNQMLQCIVACGQFTTCNNLLQYFAFLKGSPVSAQFSPQYLARMDELNEQLKMDWENFKKEPFYMYNKLTEQYGQQENYPTLSAQNIPDPSF